MAAILPLFMVLMVVMIQLGCGQNVESISSSDVDCTHCGEDICRPRCPTKTETLYIKVKVVVME